METIDPVRELQNACHAAGSQMAWAKSHGVSQSYVADVLLGRREAGEKILAALGLQRIVYYVRSAH